MDKKLKEQINTFIEDNELDLDTGSGMPIGIIAIIGYYLFIYVKANARTHTSSDSDLYEHLEEVLPETMEDISYPEWNTSFHSAWYNDYQLFWTTPEAKAEYNF
jgi:hypothetical protein|tara:strand:+ start:707 stop:1018 length:312 start_codon:yes stop_codon:yes gene_type:complete